MLTAIRINDNIKVVGENIQKDSSSKYICEYCKKYVIHHKAESKVKTGHFKHKIGESHCPNQIKETEYHIKTKLDIYNYINQEWGGKIQLIELEKWICNNTIRPDIYIETKKSKIAIEVQATILTVSEIKRRTQKYFSNNIYVLWILPFEYSRFWEYKFQFHGYSEDGKNWDWSYRDKIRLKEMEIFLYWSNFKKLIFWNLSHEHSKSFVCIELSEYVNEDVEFWRDGESHSYYGKKAKTMKQIENIIYDIPFDRFKTTYCKEFSPPIKEYLIPERLLFTY
ncbi:MAG: hypothetical protein HYZ42_14605 [Bacteroidetes bacterium]|nr:hypothetical protein [Bacteroidota bacterium]